VKVSHIAKQGGTEAMAVMVTESSKSELQIRSTP